MNVPSELRARLLDVYATFGADPEGCAYALAVRVIRHYLGEEWVTQRILLSDKPDPFMLNERDESSENRWVHQDRVIKLGDALFTLRQATNAEVLRQRFWQRDARSCFLEVTAAEDFAERGFQIEVVRESGKRGADFDFIARKAGIILSVEVTGATSNELTQRGIENILHNKRDQVPPDRPAVLYVTIPDSWTHNGAVAEAVIGGAVGRFFRGSKRFNAVVFIWNAVIPLGASRLFAVTSHPYFHPAPRHATVSLKWLRPTHPLGDLATVRMLANVGDEERLRRHAPSETLSRLLQWARAEAI